MKARPAMAGWPPAVASSTWKRWRHGLMVVAIGLAAGGELGGRQATAIPFEVVTPERIEVAALPGARMSEPVSIRNTSEQPITQVTLRPTMLVDSTTYRRVRVPERHLGPCGVGEECTWDVDLPYPTYAGVYSGVVAFSADGSSRRSIPLVIRSRGPNVVPGLDARLPYLPASLFWLVTGIGCLVSGLLDAWFAGGGRRRTLARMLIDRTRHALTVTAARVVEWQQRFGAAVLGSSLAAWQARLGDLEALDAQARELPVEALEKAVNDLAPAADNARALWQAVEFATDRLGQDRAGLLEVARQLGAIDHSLDPKAYAAALQQVMAQALEAGSATAAGLSLPPPPRRLQRLGRRVAWMDRLYVAVGWAVVALIAFVTFYDRAWSFGTARDYINVFLWTLGLTQTGTQLLARGKSSFGKL